MTPTRVRLIAHPHQMTLGDSGERIRTSILTALRTILALWDQLHSLFARVARSSVTHDALFDFHILVRSDVTLSAEYHEIIVATRAGSRLRSW